MALTQIDMLACALCIACIAGIAFSNYRRSKSVIPLPPGPPAAGLAGNAKDMPTSKPWLGYQEMGHKYGPLVHLRVFHKHFIVVNTMEVVTELFEKRGNIYSDRPAFHMLDLMGWLWNTGLMPYGQVWREHRRVLHHFFHEGVVKNYTELQTRNNVLLLRSLLEQPEEFRHHMRRLASANVLAVSYGIEVGLSDDPWVRIAEEGNDNFAAIGSTPYLVDWIPVLKYVPSWFPGAGFKRQALIWRSLVERMLHAPLDWVKSQMVEGKPAPSMAAELLQNGLQGEPLSEDVVRNCAALAYAAGTETTSTTLLFFVLAMVLNPEKQRAAQNEIDRVVGRERLPELSDRESLPYVSALLLEVFRMHPVFAIGLPRRVMDDDVFRGMRVPKGATIITNAWAMLRDERIYAQPHSFIPERFMKDGRLDATVPDPRTSVFGWGRRSCVGRPFAEASVWLAATTMLACFNIGQEKDATGMEVAPNEELDVGMLVSPQPFRCEIIPRSSAVEGLVRLAADQF